MSDKVALVTGASRGIGRATAQALAEAGFRLAIHYRSSEPEAAAVAEGLDGAKIFQADLSQEAELTELVKAVKREMGSIDILVNNAGMTVDQLVTFAKPDDFELLIRTNLRPVFLLTKHVSKIMIKQRGGRIINLSSVIGYSGNPGQSLYAATKGAITAFTKSVAIELAPFGILANCVAPGMIETEMTAKLSDEQRAQILARIPMKRMGSPSEIGQVIAFLASPAASYITGSTLHVNGGMLTS